MEDKQEKEQEETMDEKDHTSENKTKQDKQTHEVIEHFPDDTEIQDQQQFRRSSQKAPRNPTCPCNQC